MESEQNGSFAKTLYSFQTWVKVHIQKRYNFFFTKGSSSESTSKALPETSSVATITDAVEVIPSNSQENSQTIDSSILSTEKRKG